MIKIYNTASKKNEKFVPMDEGKVKMYVCGPTVYDVGHLGHGRSAVAFDVIRKYFEYKGYEVTYASNYTDIDDKMIKRAREEKVSVPDLAKRIIPEYEKDYAALGIKKPDFQPKATDYIDAIIDLIKMLEKSGYTYVLDDGVYYDISKFHDYGKLSGQNLSELQAGARVMVDENKKNPYDFVLWKLKKEDDEPSWKSPWGEGRPGWHIECSAMTWKVLGEQFDIHGGGLDLKFPHHECEVAQSRGAFGKQAFAKYWMHNGFIQIDNDKMSKSLGNFFTLKEIFEKYDPQVVRFLFLQTHYRNPINFSDKLLEQAKAGLERLHGFATSLQSYKPVVTDKTPVYNDEFVKNFEKFMDNDFDTSGALGALFEFVKWANGYISNPSGDVFDAATALKDLRKMDSVLGVIFPVETEVPDKIISMAKERLVARNDRDFKKADKLRYEISDAGYTVEDSADGYILKKKL